MGLLYLLRWQFKFKTDGTELPATDVTSRSVCCTNNVRLQSCSDKKKRKVNCTLLQALRLCTGRTAQRGSRGIALLFLDYGTRRGWMVSVTPRRLFTPGKDPVPTVQKAGLAPGPTLTGAENLASTGIRSPDRPARSQSLYRLSYPAHWPRRSLQKLAVSFHTTALHRTVFLNGIPPVTGLMHVKAAFPQRKQLPRSTENSSVSMSISLSYLV